MKASIELSHWQLARSMVQAVNPDLAAAIDAFNPDASYPLYRVRYPFGTDLVESGQIVLPNAEGKLKPLSHASIDPEIKAALNYSVVPFGICLNSSAEIYVNMDQRVIPLHVFMPGHTFGLWEVLDPRDSLFVQGIWHVAAGARSLFMLPKIADAISLNRLSKACGLHSLAPPRNIFEQAPLFNEVVHSRNIQSPWHCEIILFGSKWFQEQPDNLAWHRLHYYLLKREWLDTFYWRNKITFELVGQSFASAQAHKNLKPSNYLISTVLHIVSLAIGSSVGFEPVVQQDETSGPMHTIQKIFAEHYGLKSYIPTLFQPRKLGEKSPIYYSLQTPTVLASSPNSRITHSVIEDLRMTKRLLEALVQKLETDHPAVYSLLEHVEFTFFHTEPDDYYEIYSTQMVAEEDPRFLQNPFIRNRQFCDSGSFLRGCVRIQKKPRR